MHAMGYAMADLSNDDNLEFVAMTFLSFKMKTMKDVRSSLDYDEWTWTSAYDHTINRFEVSWRRIFYKHYDVNGDGFNMLSIDVESFDKKAVTKLIWRRMRKIKKASRI